MTSRLSFSSPAAARLAAADSLGFGLAAPLLGPAVPAVAADLTQEASAPAAGDAATDFPAAVPPELSPDAIEKAQAVIRQIYDEIEGEG
jgi:hypothetical protein